MLSQRAIDIITRDFTTIAAGSSSIFKEHFSQLLERHLVRQPTTLEVALLTHPFGETGLQLDNWLQWLQQFPQSTAHPNARGHHLRGLSATYMLDVFLAEVAAVGLSSDSKVYEVEPSVIRGKGKDIICPRDGRLGSAYVDCVPNEHVGLSSVMLSYGWSYTVGDVVDTLTQFCDNEGRDPADTRFWICCVCINQQ